MKSIIVCIGEEFFETIYRGTPQISQKGFKRTENFLVTCITK